MAGYWIDSGVLQSHGSYVCCMDIYVYMHYIKRKWANADLMFGSNKSSTAWIADAKEAHLLRLSFSYSRQPAAAARVLPTKHWPRLNFCECIKLSRRRYKASIESAEDDHKWEIPRKTAIAYLIQYNDDDRIGPIRFFVGARRPFRGQCHHRAVRSVGEELSEKVPDLMSDRADQPIRFPETKLRYSARHPSLAVATVLAGL